MSGPAPEVEDLSGADADWAPEAERLISDVETLKAISDPLRLRLLETMVRRIDPPWTVKELAGSLGVPPTRLYHHVELLLERDLVRPAGRRLVSGIVETRYRVAALSLRLDRGLFRGGPEGVSEAMHDTLRALFDGARDEIVRGLASGRIDPEEDAAPERRLFLMRGATKLAPERAQELRERLAALVEEFGADTLEAEEGVPYGLVLAIYPAEPPAAAETEYPERPE